MSQSEGGCVDSLELYKEIFQVKGHRGFVPNLSHATSMPWIWLVLQHCSCKWHSSIKSKNV